MGNNSEYLANLTDWIKPRRSENDWKLCSRASRDNNQFHSLCDEKGPTITIAKVGEYIFGGYTSLSWRKSAGKYSSLSFRVKKFLDCHVYWTFSVVYDHLFDVSFFNFILKISFVRTDTSIFIPFGLGPSWTIKNRSLIEGIRNHSRMYGSLGNESLSRYCEKP